MGNPVILFPILMELSRVILFSLIYFLFALKDYHLFFRRLRIIGSFKVFYLTPMGSGYPIFYLLASAYCIVKLQEHNVKI